MRQQNLVLFFAGFIFYNLISCEIVLHKNHQDLKNLNDYVKNTEDNVIKDGGHFLYFAYGSNLLEKRILANNPSAKRVGIGKLNDYSLDFITFSNKWKGSVATIVDKNGSYVWGALWKIDNEHMESLDRQEGVDIHFYKPLTVNIALPDGYKVSARTYQQIATPTLLKSFEFLPEERRPSKAYWKVIVKGAAESGLPTEYQELLKIIPHNEFDGDVDMKTTKNKQ